MADAKPIDLDRVKAVTESFYLDHPEIKESHGILHAKKVLKHATHAVHDDVAVAVAIDDDPTTTREDILVAALLHDVDDEKYFPKQNQQSLKQQESVQQDDNDDAMENDTVMIHIFPNAVQIMTDAGVPASSVDTVLTMISWVSCSKNGNNIPECIRATGYYHRLIPRWADRIEAVGARGVWRCYQYNQEQGAPLSSSTSPRPTTVEEVWDYATPARFEQYQTRGGSSNDMVSHYYDKLLNVAGPPSDIVWNTYLEQRLAESSKELIEVCLRFGTTGMWMRTTLRG